MLTIIDSIAAVHGPKGDTTTTWTSKKGNICSLNDKNIVPKCLSNARILTSGYNAHVLFMKGRRTSADRILQHAETLIAQLVADREVDSLPHP